MHHHSNAVKFKRNSINLYFQFINPLMKMKKTLILTAAIVAIVSFGAVQAEPVNLDTLPKTLIAKRDLQKKYLESLRKRYQMMYNNKMMTRDYFNLKRQREMIKKSQKKAHVVSIVKSELSRTGELEQDKERVRIKNPYQVKAVNPKSIFLKRAMDYYVYSGDAGSDIMDRGNINMRDHKVSRTKMLEMMYKHGQKVGGIKLEAREILKAMVAPKYEGTSKRPVNYRTGDFKNNMLSPFTSLKWLNK